MVVFQKFLFNSPLHIYPADVFQPAPERLGNLGAVKAVLVENRAEQAARSPETMVIPLERTIWVLLLDVFEQVGHRPHPKLILDEVVAGMIGFRYAPNGVGLIPATLLRLHPAD